MTLKCVACVPLCVCGEVEGAGEDVAFSEANAVLICCVVVGGGCVLSVVVAVRLVCCAALVVVSDSCVAALEVVLPAKEQTALHLREDAHHWHQINIMVDNQADIMNLKQRCSWK